MADTLVYPATATERDRFVLDRRGSRPVHHDPWQHQGVIVEDERTADGGTAAMATVFLTGRECPWRCAMCDLWKYTTASDTPRGAIAAQILAARAELQARATRLTGIKLYNAGSFFDPRAVPDADYGEIAAALAGVSHVVVESHPALIGPRVDRWLDAIARHVPVNDGRAQLEVAMGLETAHEPALDRLNKRFTLAGFTHAAASLCGRGARLRVFLLISPPFVPPVEQDVWLQRSVDAAVACGASVVSLVPTRPGNGTLEALRDLGAFTAPSLDDVERSIELALARARGRCRVFVDVWDLERLARCQTCFEHRRQRLVRINLEQRVPPRLPCAACDRPARS